LAYTQVGIINLGLGRIGVKRITSIDPAVDDSEQAADAVAVWEYVRDEVLEAKDWKFAKKRQALGMVAETPESGYEFAYLLPDDFLRIARGTKDDPSIYPNEYPYKLETMNVIVGIDGIAEFNPTSAYISAAASQVKIGRYCVLNVGSEKKLYVAATYKEDDVTFLDVECESNTIDTLAVTSSGHTITIKLANSDGTKNTAALIQAAIRALVTVDDISVAAWTVTQNAAYLASYPTTGVDISAVPMGNGDKVYECIVNVTGTAANTSLFPAIETTYWEEVSPSARLCLTIDYDNEENDEELVLAYISKVTDYSIYSPSFINALGWRLAKELSFIRTEGQNKFKICEDEYELALMKAEGVNQSFDSLTDETGNTDWVDAGR